MSFFKGFRKGMTTFGHNIAGIINTALLFIVYVVAVMPTAWIARMTGKEFLHLKPTKEKTYWQNLNLKKKPMEAYYRQF